MPRKDLEARREYNRTRYLAKREEIRQREAERYRTDPAYAEAARQRSKEWYENNKERAAEHNREYRSKEEVRKMRTESQREWRKRNPEKNRANHKAHYLRHKADKAAYRKRYAAANRAKIARQSAEYYQRTKEKRRAYSRKWWASNLALARMYSHERRAREAAVGGRHAAEDANRLWLHYKKKCAVHGCKHAIEDGGKQFGYCVDHVIPLSRGGTNNFDNLQILCKPHNSQKSNRTNEEWTDLFSIRLRKVIPMKISD